MIKFENVEDLIQLEKEASFPDRLPEKTIYKSLKRVATNFPSRPAISFQITSKPGSKSETYNWGELYNFVVTFFFFPNKLSLGYLYILYCLSYKLCWNKHIWI